MLYTITNYVNILPSDFQYVIYNYKLCKYVTFGFPICYIQLQIMYYLRIFNMLYTITNYVNILSSGFQYVIYNYKLCKYITFGFSICYIQLQIM